jgi:predicted dehydrogenase
VGPVESVCARSATFTSSRADRAGGAPASVDVDEASSALLRFADGQTGVFEVAKVCPGHPCDFTVEINGTLGTLRFDYARLNELWYADARDPGELYGMRRIRAEHPFHPQTGGWWPIGQGIGYGASFVNQAADLLQAWPEGTWSPHLTAGLQVQAVCEAIERAAAKCRWVEVVEISGQTNQTELMETER